MSPPAEPLVSLPVSLVSRWTLLLPLAALAFCLAHAAAADLRRTTRTHCRVPNYLPSVSSAVGLPGKDPRRSAEKKDRIVRERNFPILNFKFNLANALT